MGSSAAPIDVRMTDKAIRIMAERCKAVMDHFSVRNHLIDEMEHDRRLCPEARREHMRPAVHTLAPRALLCLMSEWPERVLRNKASLPGVLFP
jgi:hypothetical protein